ncbi:MAG: hypothetical protein SFY80_13280 [Verrucomicrobiota bacterium]|nr:hypothetical protein [Verrucomicrobiota bacterium]
MKKLSTILVTLIFAGALHAGDSNCTRPKEAAKPACCAGDSAVIKVADKTAVAEKLDMIKAVAEYPLTKCVVSDEKLDSMGEPFDYIYQVEGKPDRLVRLCCNSCVKKFKKNPEKYLEIIDTAVKQKAAEASKTAAHEGHQH